MVFIKGKPSKKDYRKYNIKSVIGPDDYASMREVVWRKYKRAIEEETPLPDLIIADGGVGQMNAIKDATDALGINIPIAGLAKNDKHHTNELLYGFPRKLLASSKPRRCSNCLPTYKMKCIGLLLTSTGIKGANAKHLANWTI